MIWKKTAWEQKVWTHISLSLVTDFILIQIIQFQPRKGCQVLAGIRIGVHRQACRSQLSGHLIVNQKISQFFILKRANASHIQREKRILLQWLPRRIYCGRND